MQKNALTPLSSLGEFGLIDRISSKFQNIQSGTFVGIGDDAAVLDHQGFRTLITTDLLVEGVHFDLAYAPLKHLGYKSVAVNVSDIYAMNGTPRQITVSLAVSNRFPVEAIDELYEGIRLACQNYEVDLVGGDTSSSNKGLFISVTALGTAPENKIVLRSTAQPNDLVCVSGDLGAAYMGLQLLEREKAIFQQTQSQPKLEGWDYIMARQLRPEARRDVKELFDNLDIKPTAMIDISDGLSSEILHIAQKSGVGIKVFEEKLPIAQETIDMANEFGIDPTICAMNGGEDYELLFTISQVDYEKLKNTEGISIIGHVTQTTENYLVTRDGSHIPIEAQGWNHAD